MMRDVTMAERIDGRPVCRVLIKPTACTVLAALSTIVHDVAFAWC